MKKNDASGRFAKHTSPISKRDSSPAMTTPDDVKKCPNVQGKEQEITDGTARPSRLIQVIAINSQHSKKKIELGRQGCNRLIRGRNLTLGVRRSH